MGNKPLSQTPSAIQQRAEGKFRLRLWELRQQYNNAFQAIKARAERAEKKRGFGQCRACKFWTRGGGNRKWGYCDMKRALETYPDHPRPWAYLECKPFKIVERMVTSEIFGCVIFASIRSRFHPEPGEKI